MDKKIVLIIFSSPVVMYLYSANTGINLTCRECSELPDILMQEKKFHHFIIIKIMLPLEHDSVIRRENALGDPLA
jgi:hypothetical protein